MGSGLSSKRGVYAAQLVESEGVPSQKDNFNRSSRSSTLWVSIEEADRDVKPLRQNFGEFVPLPAYEPHVNFLRILSSPSTSLQMFVSSIVLEVMRVLQADKCSIFFVDEVRRELWCVGSVDMVNFCVPLDKGIVGLVAREGKLINLADAHAHKDFDPTVEKRSGYVISSLLAVPIKHTIEVTRIVGVIQVFNKFNKFGTIGGHFSDQDAAEMQKFSMLIGDSFCRQRWKALRSRGDSDAQAWIAELSWTSDYTGPFPTSPTNFRKASTASTPDTSQSFWDQYSHRADKDGERFSLDLRTNKFDVFAHEHEELVSFVQDIFRVVGITEHLNVKPNVIHNWVAAVCGSHRNNPFHNWFHAFSVFQMCYYQLFWCGVFKNVRLIDSFGLLVAALCHDLDHPGYTNSYLIETEDEIAIRYNDSSVLENHSAFLACDLLRRKATAISGALDTPIQKCLRRIVVKCILDTDMVRHTELTHRLIGYNATSYCVIETEDERQLRLSACIHTSDLSGQTSPWTIALQWEQRISEEFNNQAQEEVAAGRIPAAFMNFNLHDVKTRSKLQLDFVDFVLLPLWEPYAQVVPEVQQCYSNLVTNRALYEQRSSSKSTAANGPIRASNTTDCSGPIPA